MTWKTPPSLKWLIVKHSRLQGTLKTLEDEAQELQLKLDALQPQIDQAKSDLAAVEQTLGLHEIKVDASDIASVVPHANRALYRHGDVTRMIYAALKTNSGWMQTADVIERATGYTRSNSDSDLYTQLRRAFRLRLQVLTAQGKVERRLPPGWVNGAHNQVLWRLPPPSI